MTRFTAEGMKKLELAHSERQQKLNNLTKKSFEPRNEAQVKELEKYIIEFESNANKIYLARGLTYAIHTYLGYRAFNFIFPIMPQVVTDLLAYGVVLGMGGLAYKELKVDDFKMHLNEMRVLYNWVLKGNQEEYSDDIDNSRLLANPLIQRMIETMAPFCSTDFMIVWPKVVKEEERKSDTGLLNTVASIGKSALSWWSPPPKQDLSQSEKINDMKNKVETGGYNLSVLAGLKRAVGYFFSDKDSHELMKASLPDAYDLAKETLLEPFPELVNYKTKLM
ncbi:hypothetical protein [Legionella waltersii]|uniref:Phosphatase n=1 Tax=Legionella waltersii TaxID=66969 RepID=A0A0W1A1K3_9GAMM|nr:hypothetical protein [Legionella waltersii]KTD75113.1 phosphatase [Legionella waltersii]SNV05023.1 phosphatase [Legionella waltersii]